jgi:hypothetical protein
MPVDVLILEPELIEVTNHTGKEERVMLRSAS